MKPEPGASNASISEPLLVDVVSNVNDPSHRRVMCSSMVDTYQGVLAPPVLRYVFISSTHTGKILIGCTAAPLTLFLLAITLAATVWHPSREQ